MKRMIALVVLISSVLSAADHYQRFLDAYKKNDTNTAFTEIAAAYRASPGTDYLSYWYGIMLSSTEHFDESISVLNSVPASYYPHSVRWYVMNAYLKTGRSNDALTEVRKIIDVPEEKPQMMPYIYSTFAGLCDANGDAEAVAAYDERIDTYFASLKGFDDSANYTRYLMAKTYGAFARKALLSGQSTTAVLYFDKALRLYPKLPATHTPPLSAASVSFYRELARSLTASPRQDAEYTHRVFVMTYTNLEAVWQDASGKKRISSNRLPYDFI